MDALRHAENTIFELRKKAALFLFAGNTKEFARIQNTISHLQELYGATKGRGKDTDNAGIDYWQNQTEEQTSEIRNVADEISGTLKRSIKSANARKQNQPNS